MKKRQPVSLKLTDILISLRPAQWLKNLVVFAAITFSQELFILEKFRSVFYTFLIFCAASSAMYLINDLVDRPADQLHFSKKFRPIAAGRIPTGLAVFLAFILMFFALAASYWLSNYLFLTLLIYLGIQLSYSFWLKGVILLDILVIAIAFMLRIFAGSLVVLTPLSSWLILTTMMLALFLAVGKRKSELTLLSARQESRSARKTLLDYPSTLLDGLAFMMATATLITYSLFTFNSPELPQKEFFAQLFPRTLSTPKLLMATIPIVVYGILRYLYLIFEKKQGESPEKVLLGDRPLFASVVFWIASVLFILYFFSL